MKIPEELKGPLWVILVCVGIIALCQIAWLYL